MIRPVKIRVQKNSDLLIKWGDGTESSIPSEVLRRLCPCASCKIERESQSENYIPLFDRSQITISSVKPVGSYAIAVSWKDGHSTGIYEYAYLKLLTVERSAG
jgi:DUF971 family protein